MWHPMWPVCTISSQRDSLGIMFWTHKTQKQSEASFAWLLARLVPIASQTANTMSTTKGILPPQAYLACSHMKYHALPINQWITNETIGTSATMSTCILNGSGNLNVFDDTGIDASTHGSSCARIVSRSIPNNLSSQFCKQLLSNSVCSTVTKDIPSRKRNENSVTRVATWHSSEDASYCALYASAWIAYGTWNDLP